MVLQLSRRVAQTKGHPRQHSPPGRVQKRASNETSDHRAADSRRDSIAHATACKESRPAITSLFRARSGRLGGDIRGGAVSLTTLGSPGLGRSPLEQYLDFSESLIEAFFRLSCRRRPKRAWHEGVPEAQISSSFLPCQSLLLTLRALRATQIIVRSTLQALEDFPSCEERCCCTGGGVSLSDVDRDGTLPPLRGARRSNPPVR